MGKRLMIVEDESLIAMDLKTTLERLGYSVVAEAASAEEAFRKAREIPLDLVLMDIRLQNGSDGVEAAEHIRMTHKIPVIYLTSHTDDDTLRRAMRTEPFGYVVKPYRARELRAGIEMALYKHSMEKRLQQREEWFSSALRSIGDGVIATDDRGRVVFMNTAAERLTGWELESTVNKTVKQVFNIASKATQTVIEGGDHRASSLRQLTNKKGERLIIDDTMAPLVNNKGERTGAVIAFREVIKRPDDSIKWDNSLIDF